MTQNFTVVEAQTEKKGVYVPVKDTVADVRAILDGKYDLLQPEDFSFIGSLKDLDQKMAAATAAKNQAESQNAPQTAATTAPDDQTQQQPQQQQNQQTQAPQPQANS